jgi:magnesium chelatase family protein
MATQGCPCGYLGSSVHSCRCGPAIIERYLARISGPLLDRIDMHLRVPALPYGDLASETQAELSATIRTRVEAARTRQRERFRAHRGPHANAHMSSREVRRHCRQTPEISELLRSAVERLGLSARAWHRVLKVARTIADLGGTEQIEPPHVREAIQYRSSDRMSR